MEKMSAFRIELMDFFCKLKRNTKSPSKTIIINFFCQFIKEVKVRSTKMELSHCNRIVKIALHALVNS